MKKKILMLFLCCSLSLSMLAGCSGEPGDSGEILTPAEPDEDEEEEAAPVEEEADTEEETEPVSEEEPAEEVNAMPRSDAYDMFIAGEMDVTVVYDDEYTGPDAGTYSYEELRDAAIEELGYGQGGEYDVKYALFTPDSGQEGDDVLVMYIENHDPSFLNWIGFIGYNNGKLELNYYTQFGYRSYFDLYYSGDILCGGSGGAGAHYQDYKIVKPDATVETVYSSAYLYAAWCSDVFYTIDPEYDYTSIPELDEASALEMTRVTKDGTVFICVSKWSDTKAVKEQEEAYVQALVDLGAVVVDEAEIERISANSVDESKTMTWNDIETVTVEPDEEV